MLTKERILKINDCESWSTCESYLLKKMIKSSFIEKDERACEVLSLIHIDVYGPINTSARGWYYCFISFTNDLSRYRYVYRTKHKYESFS